MRKSQKDCHEPRSSKTARHPVRRPCVCKPSIAMPATYLLVCLESYIWYRAVTTLDLQRAKPAVHPSLLYHLRGWSSASGISFLSSPSASTCRGPRCGLRGSNYLFFRKIVCQVGGSGFHVSAVSVSCPASAWSSLVVLLVLPVLPLFLRISLFPWPSWDHLRPMAL